jgi:hypothetical protein
LLVRTSYGRYHRPIGFFTLKKRGTVGSFEKNNQESKEIGRRVLPSYNYLYRPTDAL